MEKKKSNSADVMVAKSVGEQFQQAYKATGFVWYDDPEDEEWAAHEAREKARKKTQN